MNQPNSWYKVKAVDFDNAEIGNIYGNEANIQKRVLLINANNLPEVKTKPGFKLGFRLISSTENTANAQLEALVLSREQVGRMVRHNSSKIDVVRKIKIDEKEYAIKAVILINKAENKYKTAIRKEIDAFIKKETENKELKEVMLDAMGNKLQNPLHKALNKIYPTKAVEIRMIEPSK